MARCEQVQVALRFRPLNLKELEERDQEVWSISHDTVCLKPELHGLLLDAKRISSAPKVYSYNQCFSSKDRNCQVYSGVARRVVLASLDGYNGTIFAYGQTGSGKTFTMMGSNAHGVEGDPGVVLQALDDLFNVVLSSSEKTYYLSCSYLEIYNEQVYDLLADNPGVVLPVSEDPHKGFYVKGLGEHVVNSKEEVLRYIEVGEAARRYAATAMNHHSSRSHTIFQLHVTSVLTPAHASVDKSVQSITTESLLNFVDLAGSERVGSLQEVSTDKRKQRGSLSNLDTLVQEGRHINTSLFYLCQVISRLADKTNRSEHVPYRNSNLTKILRSSLGGNSLTCIICTATPSLSQFEMTLSTLRFGGKAQTITNQVAANVRSDQNAELIAAYQKNIEELRKELEQATLGGRAKAEEAALVKRNLEERIARLTKMLITKTKSEPVKASSPLIIELWAANCGDLMVDSRLLRHDNWSKYLLPGKTQLKFDSKGLLALEKLREGHRDKVRLDKELQELKKANDQLSVSKLNLTHDLKKSVELCKKLSDRKSYYKHQATTLEAHSISLERKLDQLENFVGFETMTYAQLEELERFFYRGLDASKEARIRKKFGEETGTLMDKTNCNLRDYDARSDSESSLEFESSFYKGKSPLRQAADQENSCLLLAQMLDFPDTPHLSEIGDSDFVYGDLC
mmetsp:Transcript_981/g.2443  ORF Transcript_981/g.2443 Transcript_981/m.2443 type:complete len:683 (+) Transcript_981:2524-4572(+)